MNTGTVMERLERRRQARHAAGAASPPPAALASAVRALALARRGESPAIVREHLIDVAEIALALAEQLDERAHYEKARIGPTPRGSHARL
jgi:hypothetical protein